MKKVCMVMAIVLLGFSQKGCALFFHDEGYELTFVDEQKQVMANERVLLQSSSGGISLASLVHMFSNTNKHDSIFITDGSGKLVVHLSNWQVHRFYLIKGEGLPVMWGRIKVIERPWFSPIIGTVEMEIIETE